MKNLKIGFTPKGEAVQFPLKMLTRHGLICGSTGSGKTKTVQYLAEELSREGVPSFHLDIKGDLSGLGGIGEKTLFIEERYKSFGLDYKPQSFPTQFFTISGGSGYELKYSLQSFGAAFLSNVLRLNTTQEGLMLVLFEFAKNEGIALNTLDELIQLIIFAISEEGQVKISQNYGRMSGASLSTVLRKIVGFKGQGGDNLFENDTFSIETFLQEGRISILSVSDIQNKQEIFSAFMLKLLMQIYDYMPEVGDLDKPRLVFFIDEAHLIFSQARKELSEKLASIVRLIRSKGVGLIFCTQSPADIPNEILGQLGLKIQHTLRAFTAKDRTAIKQAAENYPLPEGWKVARLEALMTKLKIAEALVSGLDLGGNPEAVQQTRILTPSSKMGVLNLIQNNNTWDLLGYATPATGTALKSYIADHKKELTELARANPNFDFYQTIKVVNSGSGETFVATNTPPEEKKEPNYKSMLRQAFSFNDNLPPEIESIGEKLIALGERVKPIMHEGVKHGYWYLGTGTYESLIKHFQ